MNQNSTLNPHNCGPRKVCDRPPLPINNYQIVESRLPDVCRLCAHAADCLTQTSWDKFKPGGWLCQRISPAPGGSSSRVALSPSIVPLPNVPAGLLLVIARIEGYGPAKDISWLDDAFIGWGVDSKARILLPTRLPRRHGPIAQCHTPI